MLENLKKDVFEANLLLPKYNLVLGEMFLQLIGKVD